MLRTGIVLATDEGMAARMAAQYRRGFGAIIGSRSQWLPWIHIDDVAGLYDLALTDDRIGDGLNVAAPHPARYRDCTEPMAAIAGRPVRLKISGTAVRLALGDVADSVLHNRRMIPAKALEVGYEYRFCGAVRRPARPPWTRRGVTSRRVFAGFYRLGFTPWDGHSPSPDLCGLIEGSAGAPALTRRPPDFVDQSLRAARKRTAAAGVDVTFVRVGTHFDPIVDAGCLQNMAAKVRADYVREITEAAAPNALLFVVEFPPKTQRGVVRYHR